MKTDWIKPYEPTLHRLMGFGAMLFNLRLLLTRREMKQLPPENADYPALFVAPNSGPPRHWVGYDYRRHSIGSFEYWSKIRVMDTLDDSKQYDEGGAIAWFVLVGASVAAGWFLRGWLSQ